MFIVPLYGAAEQQLQVHAGGPDLIDIIHVVQQSEDFEQVEGSQEMSIDL